MRRGYRTEQTIATVQAAGEADVDAAVKAARKALKDPSWKRLSATDRGILMAKLADLMESKRELFATVDAWDNGMIYLSDIVGFRIANLPML